MVSQQLVEELKTIIKEDYGKDLEIKEIAQIANNLVGYFNLLAKIHLREKESENRYDNTKNTNK
ncbi:MAG: hypothetical protein ACPLXB_01190 [Minisyncoccia bacterium]